MRRRRKLNWKVGCGAIGAVVLVVLAGFVGLSAFGGDHTVRSVAYDLDPPHSGKHSPVWQKCGFYTEPVENEHVVHSLEHGAVWITYRPDLPADQVTVLRELVRTRDYLVISPYPDLPAPIVITAWEQQTLLDATNLPHLQQLIQEYRDSEAEPEPDGSCDGPNLWFTGSTGNPDE